MTKGQRSRSQSQSEKLFAVICEGDEGLPPMLIQARSQAEAERIGRRECGRGGKRFRGVYETTPREIEDMVARHDYYCCYDEDKELPYD